MKFLIFLTFLTSITAQPFNISEEISSSISIVSKSTKNSDICDSSDGIKRECVPYYLCVDGKVNRDGMNVINVRSGGNSKVCVQYFEECCVVESRKAKKVENSCGKRNFKKVSYKITADHDGDAEIGEFPWMIAILREESSNFGSRNVYQCGGSLVTSSVVLTVAHCVFDRQPEVLKVRAGEWDTQIRDEKFPHFDVDVERILVHEDFQVGTLQNGIALLMLKNELKLAGHVGVVCLPPQNYNFENKNCIVTGWGKDTFGIEGNYQTVLKRLELPIVSNENCEKSLRKTRLGKWFRLHAGFLCAGGERGRDTCQGDGGSPLVCPIDGQPGFYYQAGIVAWGIGCGEGSTPGVYINVAKYRNWIDEQIRENSRNINKKFISI